MKFAFEVGQNEKHQVDFQWSKWLGVAKIWVDGVLVLKSRPLAFAELAQAGQLLGTSNQIRYLHNALIGKASPSLVRLWSFEVGEDEKHAITIAKERPHILAALRPHIYRVFVDEALCGEYRG
jgi:hypothetical protein